MVVRFAPFTGTPRGFFHSTGGATPVAASHLIADDLDAGNLAGAVRRLHPDEVALGADLGGVLHDELVRLQVVRPDADRDALLHGVTFANLRFDDAAVEQVRPDVAIAKLVGGTVTVSRDVGALPLTDSYRHLAFPNGAPAAAPEVTGIAQDARRLVELAPPHELAVVHDVGPRLVADAGIPHPTARLVDLAATPAAVPGGTALTVDRIVAEDDGGGRVTAVRDGDCVAVTPADGAPTRLCAQDVVAQGLDALPTAADPAVRDMMVRVARAALGLRVVVVEDDGQYYVSPLRTIAGLGIDVLHTLQPPELARLMTMTA